MKLIHQLNVLLFVICLPLFLTAQKQVGLFTNQKQIAEGLVWRQIKSANLFDSPQNINILEIGRAYDFKMAYATDTLIRTSDFARSAGALAAINGGFFDMKNGGSVTFQKVDGRVIQQTAPRFIEAQNEILESALVITRKGDLLIRPTDDMPQWQNKKKYATILVTGPLLVYDNQPLPLVNRNFTNTRHPRSCACTTKDQKTLLFTVDGRHEEAKGMSLQELTRLALILNCQNAINLDGGGSTTLFIQGQSDTGVVNRPSDNKKFDHKGERACANAILVMKKK